MIPRISTKGMVFSLLSAAADIDTLNTTRLSVIVVGANPALSKSFYKGEYFEDTAKPDCYSLDGKTPDKD